MLNWRRAMMNHNCRASKTSSPQRGRSIRWHRSILFAAALVLPSSAVIVSMSNAPVASGAVTGNAIPIPPGSSNVLMAGQTLEPGQAITDGNQVLIMQGDGNFVDYIASSGFVEWDSGTSVPGSFISMQTAGNLVIYSPTGTALWTSFTDPSIGDRLEVGPIIFTPGNIPLWSGGFGAPPAGVRSPFLEDSLLPGQALYPNQGLISANGRYEAVLQEQGNFVLYDLAVGRAIWSTPVLNTNQTILAMQTDGNLVEYSTFGPTQAFWYTGTNSASPVRLVLQNDGNLVLYNADGAIWDYGSGRI
jgi:hypothetical protein